ncbi:hypothetical protein LYNGBM3L_34000 [Moorena producens 3L]|uniref:Uncharacterized protein n=1 Tax=Moorena producens 3L TaxID=489825 RepID=F4XPR7_9CYAN|nr:hypothetical protein LYNGBM3L_34000 [Moorena producens 3L]
MPTAIDGNMGSAKDLVVWLPSAKDNGS